MRIARIIAAFSCLSVVSLIHAEGIVISQASSTLVADVYQLDARLEFNFNDEVLEALEHGVSISIDIIILINRERDWLWDPKVKEETLSYRLEQHPLSNRYLITDLINNDRSQTPTLTAALDYLGTINNHFLISRDVLIEGERYIGMMKAELNTETLPPVIRPVAAVSKKWRMESPWYEWRINE